MSNGNIVFFMFIYYMFLHKFHCFHSFFLLYVSVPVMDILPFNGLEDEEEFKSVVLESNFSGRMGYLSDKLFLPFELNDDENHNIMNNLDPDFNYFSSYNQYVSSCNYFIEASFMKEINKCSNIQANFSLCSFNIRSMRKNLGSFSNYLDILHHNFSVIGLTETWLKDEDCDLFNIPGYQMVEKHRTARNGGGVALCLKDGIEYTVCHDLIVFNDYMESVFIEINKKTFDTEKDMII